MKFRGGMLTLFLFHTLIVLPMQKDFKFKKVQQTSSMDIIVCSLLLQCIKYVSRSLFELSPIPAVLPKKEQELIGIGNSDKFIPQRVDHLIEVLGRLTKRNSSRELKAIVPLSHLVQKLKLARRALDKEPDDKRLKTLVGKLTQKTTEFYLDLNGLTLRDENAQDLYIYDSAFHPFPVECSNIPEDLLIKSGYVNKQLKYFVNVLKKFHENDKREICKKVVSPLCLALVIKGAEKLLEGSANLRQNSLDGIVSLENLKKYAQKNMAQINQSAGENQIKNIWSTCFCQGNLYEITVIPVGSGVVFTSGYRICETCKDRTIHLIEQYNTLSREVERCNVVSN